MKIAIVVKNARKTSFEDLSAFSIYIDDFPIINPSTIKTFNVDTVETINLETEWITFKDAPHTLKILSSTGIQTTFVCVPENTINGYC